MYSGIVVGALLFLISPRVNLTIAQWILFHALILVPTAVQPFLQVKTFKIFSRMLLGIGIASYFMTGFSLAVPINSWVFRSVQLIAFGTGYLLLSAWRERKIDNPCSNCPLGSFPVCEWNLPRLLQHPDQTHAFGEMNVSKVVSIEN